MFRREIKKQFNENKYNVLTQKGKSFANTDFCLRYPAEIATGKGPLPEVDDRLAGSYPSWFELH